MLSTRFRKYVSQKPTNVNMWQFIIPCRAITKKTQKFKKKGSQKLQSCVLVEQTYILYEILTPKNETDISMFVKHMTDEKFRVISHINKDSGATGAFENFITIYSKKDISIPKLSLVLPVWYGEIYYLNTDL